LISNKDFENISNKFSQESLESISHACNIAYKNGKKVCTSIDLFQSLCQNQLILQFLEQIKFDYKSILEKIKFQTNNLQVPIRIRKGVVVFSPDLKVTIYRSFLISKNSPIDIVGLEDIFLSTLYSSQINQIAKNLNINISKFENLINSLKGDKPKKSSHQDITFDRYFINISNKASSGKLDQVVDRESEFSQVSRILSRKDKNNVIILGEAGVGKSSVANLLAIKILNNNSLSKLQNIDVLEFNISSFTSSLLSRNSNDLIEIFKDKLIEMGRAILVIKNFNLNSNETTYENTILKEILGILLSIKNLRIILTMNSSAYKNALTNEPNLFNKFETVKIEEPSIDLSIKILKSISNKFEKFHNITINKDTLKACVSLSKRYIQDRFLPSKAIDLLDETCSQIVLENKTTLTIDDIKAVLSDKTGIPIEKLSVSEKKKLINLEIILNETIIGQKEAVHIVSEVVRRNRAGLKDPKKPIGSFLFLGPSGVGKTFLAKNLAKIIYNNEQSMIRLDMSEFSESHTVQRLIGSPPGYIGYGEGGQLTNPVWERPYSLILLDEIEKAHPNIFDIFLQVLDEGRLTDGQGRTINFKNTIIIATSNIATEEILAKFSKKDKKLSGFERDRFYEEEILPLLKSGFRPEFINRFDEIVVFNPLGINDLKIIARLQINKIQKRLTDKEIKIKVSDTKLQDLAQKSYNPSFGARPLIRLIQENIENVIAKKIINGEIKKGDTISL